MRSVLVMVSALVLSPGDGRAEDPAANEVDATAALDAAPTPNPAPRSRFEGPAVVVSLGVGLPTDRYEAIKRFDLEVLWPQPRQQLDVGTFISQTVGRHVDGVYFPATGYSEARDYEVTSQEFGLLLTYELFERAYGEGWQNGAFYAGAGVSRSFSVLKSITTTAPTPPSLQAGLTSEDSWGFTYRLGGQYEHEFQRFVLGATAGYHSTSTAEQANIAAWSVAAHVKYRFGKDLTPSATPSPSPAHSSGPAPTAP